MGSSSSKSSTSITSPTTPASTSQPSSSNSKVVGIKENAISKSKQNFIVNIHAN